MKLLLINELLKFFKQYKTLISSKLKYLLKNKQKIVNNNAIISRFFVGHKYIVLFQLVLIICASCSEWSPEKDKVVARVGDHYLYLSDFQEELGVFNSETDSLFATTNYIESWVKNQLMVQLAMQNLRENELADLEKLIDQYRSELYSNAYVQSVVNKTLDTLVTLKEIDSFLISNKNVFKLNAPLYKARFIHLPPDNVDQNKIQRSFQRFNSDDRHFLDSLSFQYYNFLLSDSIWLNKRDLLSEVYFLNEENAEKYLKKSQFFRVEDTLGVYLLFIDELLNKGETVPRVMLESTIKNIIRNQKKLKFTKQFEKEIIQDAIQSKTYERY